MNINLSDYKISPFVLVFLKDYEGKVLFLKRSLSKQIYPGKISGIGGKIEPQESLESAARREFREETGLRIDKLFIKGTFFGIVTDKNYINVSYIVLATRYFGELKKKSTEGELFWEYPKIVANNPILVTHISKYLLQVTDEESDFYSGTGIVTDWQLIQYNDNRLHFQDRKND